MDGIQVFMQELAEKAGALAMEFFNGIRPNEVYSKATAKDLVSTADGQVEALLTRMIRERFPDHGVFGEESGKNKTLRYRTTATSVADPATNNANLRKFRWPKRSRYG